MKIFPLKEEISFSSISIKGLILWLSHFNYLKQFNIKTFLKLLTNKTKQTCLLVAKSPGYILELMLVPFRLILICRSLEMCTRWLTTEVACWLVLNWKRVSELILD